MNTAISFERTLDKVEPSIRLVVSSDCDVFLSSIIVWVQAYS